MSEQNDNNYKVIAVKLKFVIKMFLILGIILMVCSAVSLVSFILSGLMPIFIFQFIFMGAFGLTLIYSANKYKKQPNELITANNSELLILKTGERIPFETIKSITSKYNNRKLIITTKDDLAHVVLLVEKVHDTKKLIEQLIKDKTNNDIVIN